MADLPNNSFIPKRGPARKVSGSGAKQVYVFTLVSYISIFATLIGSGGVFLYQKYINSSFEKEVVAMNEVRKNFDDADLKRVQEFDTRLSQASDRLNASASIVSVFTALEEATIDKVQLESLMIERVGDEKFTLAASIITDSFDSTLFQRKVFEDSENVGAIAINEFTAASAKTESEEENTSVYSFTAEIDIPLSNVPYLAEGQDKPSSQTIVPLEESTTSSTTSASSTNDTVDNQQSDI